MTKFVRINLYEFYDRNSRPIDRAAQFLARIKQEFGNELNQKTPFFLAWLLQISNTLSVRGKEAASALDENYSHLDAV